MDTIMEYQGLVAEIEYDEDEDSYFGCVVNISSPITFYGKTKEDLEREFARSVEIWLEVCHEHGIAPEIPHAEEHQMEDHHSAGMRP